MARGSNLLADPDGSGFRNFLDRTVLAEHNEEIVAPLLVDERRADPARRQHVGYRRQFVEFETDLARYIFRFCPGRRHAHRDNFADVAELARRQDRFARTLESLQRRRRDDRLDVGQIRGREHGAAKSLRDVHLLEPRMRDRTAHEGYVAHAGETEIADILSASAQKPVVLLPKHRSSDSVLRHPAASAVSVSTIIPFVVTCETHGHG